MSAKNSANSCLGLLNKWQSFLPRDKILEGADNFQKPANIPALIDELGKGHFESIQKYAEQSILKPSSDSQDKFLILVHQDEAASSEMNVLFVLSALAYDKGDTACLKEMADQYQYHEGVGHLMNNLGVMFAERMDYQISETCFEAAKRCFEQQFDHLRSAVASLNVAFLHKLFGNYKSALSCCDTAAALCHDVSMRTIKDVNLPWKVLRRVAGLCQEFGNYKKYKDVLRIGVLCEISGTNESPTGYLTKQLMTLQLREQNGEKIEAHEQLDDLASQLFELFDCSCTDKLPKPELINADFITIVIVIAKMYRDIGCLEKACKLLEKLQTTFLLVHGRKCSLYGTLLFQIGSFELGTGKTSEAVRTLKRAEEVFVYYFGRSHHMVASCKKLLGACALLKEDTREASAYLNEALMLFKQMNYCHPRIAEIYLKFAILYSETGQFESAKTTMEEALNIFTLACGEVSPEMANAYIQAAAILQKVKKFRASAVEKVKKAIVIFLQLGLRCDHPDVMTCRNFLGVLQLSLGQSKDAEEQFTEVQQQISVRDYPCLTSRIIAPESTNMFFQVKSVCDKARCMGSCIGTEVVSLVNLVHMKKGKERRNQLNTLLGCLQGRETEVPLVWDSAGQIVYYISHRMWTCEKHVYCILALASPPDRFRTGQGLNYEEPNVFLLSSSNGHTKSSCSLVFCKTSKVLEMKHSSHVNSAFCENVNMLFLQPKFRKAYLEVQDLYMELTLPHDSCAALSLCSQLDFLPLVVEEELSDSLQKCGSTDSVVYTSLLSAVKPLTHVSHFSFKLSSQHQAVLVFGNLVLSLRQALAPTKLEGVEISSASALENGAFFLVLEPSNSSLSVVVKKETVLVKCRTVKESESYCICSLVKNTLKATMASLCRVVELKFDSSVQLPCDGVGGDKKRESANCSCGREDFQSESTTCNSDHSLDTLDFHARVRSREPELDHLGKPSVEMVQNENEEDIIFPDHFDTKISTEVCVSFLDCLLSNRHALPEVQSSGTGEMLSTDSACLNDNMQLESSLLSPGSVSSLKSLPTSPSNGVIEMPAFLPDKSSSWLEVAMERFNEKKDSNADHLSEHSSMACAGCNESPLTFQEMLLNSPAKDSLLQDCSDIIYSHEEDIPSGESFDNTEMTEIVQFEGGKAQLNKEESQILRSEIAFSQNQCHQLRQRILELEEKLQQCETEKQQLELELGMKSFLEDKKKRSQKVLQSLIGHVSEQSKSSTASDASYAFSRLSMRGTLLGEANPQQRPGISQQGALMQISSSLSEAELRQMKFLVSPKVDSFRLKKIREGHELFEELETNGDISRSCVRELLKGIQRYDLLEKLDRCIPLLDSSESGHKQEGSQDDDLERHFTAPFVGEYSNNESKSTSTLNIPQTKMPEWILGNSNCTTRSVEGSNRAGRKGTFSSSSDRSEVDKVKGPKHRGSMQNAQEEWSQTVQVRQETSSVNDNLAGHSYPGRIENDEPVPLVAEPSRVTDCSIPEQPLDVHRWDRFGARPKDKGHVQRVPMEEAPVEQVRQERPCDDVLPRYRYHGRKEDDKFKPVGAQALKEADSPSRIAEQPIDARCWERFGARPRDRAPVQRPVEQVRQEPPCDHEVLARYHCQGRMEDDDSIPLGAEAFEAADFDSKIGGAGQLDARTGGSYNEDGESLLVPLPSATLPASIDDCICESLDSTNNSRLAAREGISNPRVIRGVARVSAQIQREREELERRVRSIWPRCGLTPRL